MARRKVANWLRAPRVCSLELERLDLQSEDVRVAQAVRKAAECQANAFRVPALGRRGMAYFVSRSVPSVPGMGSRNFIREAQDACKEVGLQLIVTIDAGGIDRSHPLAPEGACSGAARGPSRSESRPSIASAFWVPTGTSSSGRSARSSRSSIPMAVSS